jgi:hypothetical protein
MQFYFQQKQVIKSLYKGILGRNPTQSEIQDRIKILTKNSLIESQIIDMINSEEFNIMNLAFLVQKATNVEQNLKLFYLHVPKTSGTSLRIILSKYMGIPAYLLYLHNGIEGVKKFKNMEFWPFWVGHANISIFPNSHFGFTSFRETRSRLISEYRQVQKNLSPGYNMRNNSNKLALDHVKYYFNESKNFNSWLRSFGSSICSYYIPNTNSDVPDANTSDIEKFKYYMGTSRKWVTQIDNAHESEVRSSIQHSIKRFKAASWVEDDKSFSKAIKELFGERDMKINIPKLNVFEANSKFRPEVISKQSVEIMEELSRKDQIVFESAMNEGILSEEMKFNKEEAFSDTKKRLGFEFKNV